jgi:hypothetical protein
MWKSNPAGFVAFLGGAVLGAIIVSIVGVRRDPPGERRDGRPAATRLAATRDIVDIASEDSFPASDAPAY